METNLSSPEAQIALYIGHQWLASDLSGSLGHIPGPSLLAGGYQEMRLEWPVVISDASILAAFIRNRKEREENNNKTTTIIHGINSSSSS